MNANNTTFYIKGRQSPARGPNPARKICRSGPRRPVSCNIVTCGVEHGLAFQTHTQNIQWPRHCNLIRYTGYSYKQPAATASTAAWLVRQHQVTSRSPNTQLHVWPATSLLEAHTALYHKKFADPCFTLLTIAIKKLQNTNYHDCWHFSSTFPWTLFNSPTLRDMSRIMHTELHWLDVPERIKYVMLMYWCQHNKAPRFLMDHCTSVSDVGYCQRLRSASSQ